MSGLHRWLKAHPQALARAADLLCAWLTGCAGMAPVFAYTSPAPAGRLFFCGLFGLAAVFCLIRWRWLGPALLGMGGLFLWRFSKTEEWEAFLEDARGYLNGCLFGFPEAEGLQAAPDPLLFQLLTGLVLCALAYLFFRRLFAYPALLCIAAAQIAGAGFAVYEGRAEYSLISLGAALAAGALAISLPRVYAGFLARSAEPGEAVLPRISLQLLAIPAAAVCIGAALLLVPQDTSGWRSQALVGLWQDIGDLLHISGAGGYGEYSLAGGGYQPLGDRLGGPVELSDRPLYRVWTERPVLLRGSVQDTYTGSFWMDSTSNGRFRLDSPLFGAKKKQALCSDLPKGRQARALFEELTGETELELQPLYYRDSAFFLPDRIERVAFRDPTEATVYFNAQGEVFTSVPAGRPYLIEGRAFPAQNAYVIRRLEELTLLCEAKGSDRRYEEAAAQYLQLPDTLPDTVRQHALALTAGEDTPYRKAAAIRDWLKENCRYTLSPAEPPENRDFVDWFLQTREGYCTYYASAMTVLSRCAGLPARYVSGFGLREDTQKDWYYISEATGHAWSEIYFSGLGWVPFDPLGWSTAALRREQSAPDGTADVPFEPEPEPDPEPEPSQPLPEASSQSRRGLLTFLSLLPLILLAAAGALLLLLRFPQLYWGAERLRRLPPERQLWELFSDMLCQLLLLGFPIRPGETLLEFGQRLDGAFFPKDKECPAKRAAGWITALRFGGRPPEKEELDFLVSCHARLEELLLQQLGRKRYFLRCAAAFLRAAAKALRGAPSHPPAAGP